jgi:hypothetical protein
LQWREDKWAIDLELSAGTYFYKYIVNEQWFCDGNAPQVSEDGIVNNVLNIGKFQLLSYLTKDPLSLSVPFWWDMGGKEVCIKGSWDAWKEARPLRLVGNSKFYTEVSLPLGNYTYKFVVDGDFKFDDRQPHVTDWGYVNNYQQVS